MPKSLRELGEQSYLEHVKDTLKYWCSSDMWSEIWSTTKEASYNIARVLFALLVLLTAPVSVFIVAYVEMKECRRQLEAALGRPKPKKEN